MKPWIAELAAAWGKVWQTTLAFLPKVVGAVILLLVGWLIARVCRVVAFRLFKRLSRFGAVGREIEGSGVDEVTPKVLAQVVFWIVFVLFIAAAGQALGLTVITGGLSRLAQYLPSVMAAVVVVGAGVVSANLVRAAVSGAARTARIPQAELVGQGARIAVLTVAVVIAIEQVGINSTVLIVAIGLVLGGVVGGAALAFGLGSRGSVANLVAAHHLVQVYRPGQRVKIGDIEGRIIQLTRSGVAIETDDGEALVPAKLFEESASLRLDEAS